MPWSWAVGQPIVGDLYIISFGCEYLYPSQTAVGQSEKIVPSPISLYPASLALGYICRHVVYADRLYTDVYFATTDDVNSDFSIVEPRHSVMLNVTTPRALAPSLSITSSAMTLSTTWAATIPRHQRSSQKEARACGWWCSAMKKAIGVGWGA